VPRGTQPLTSPLADHERAGGASLPGAFLFLIGGRRALRALWSPAPPLASGWQSHPPLAPWPEAFGEKRRHAGSVAVEER